MGIVCGYLSMVTTLIAVACTQFQKLNVAILDIREQLITPHHGQELEYDHRTANCDLKSKLRLCIQHHQNIIE
jgi:hypothetical protein